MEAFKKIWEAVDAGQKGWTALATLLGLALPHFGVRSASMRWVLEAAVAVGCLLGFLVTVARWKGKGWDNCRRGIKRYLLFALLPLLALIVLFTLLEPEIAKALSAEWLHGFLVSSSVLPNAIAFLGGFFAAFLLVGAIVLSSPRLQQSA